MAAVCPGRERGDNCQQALHVMSVCRRPTPLCAPRTPRPRITITNEVVTDNITVVTILTEGETEAGG